MNNDLASLTGRPKATIAVDGERYAIHPLTVADLGAFQEWVSAQLPDPVESVKRFLGKGLSMAQEKHLLAAAVEAAARPRALIGTPEGDAIAGSPAGVAKMLELSIRKGRPGFDEDAARALFERLDLASLAAARVASGMELVAGDADPNGDGPAPTPTPAPTPPAPPSTGGSSSTA